MKLLALLFGGAALAAAHDPHHRHNPIEGLGRPEDPLELEAGVTLHVGPETPLEKSGEWVTVTWDGVSEPSTDDWIAVYSPSTVDISRTAPIKYANASESASHTVGGSGAMRVRLVNLREDYLFVFYRRGLLLPHVAARSNVVSFANPNEPLQGHLALTGDPTEMRVSWVTRDSPSPRVRVYPFGRPEAVEEVPAVSATYTADMLCNAPATTTGWRDPGMLHSAVISGLTPGRQYTYSFGDDEAAGGWSEERTFKTAPEVGYAGTVSMFAFGDMGTAQPDVMQDYGNPMETPALSTTDHLQADMDDTDVVLHIGDISYARGFSAHWDEFADQIEPVATRLPWMTQHGNHERDSNHTSWFQPEPSFYNGDDSHGECGVPTEMRYLMPAPADVPQAHQPWYSFDYGSVHVVLFSSEVDFRVGSDQHDWLAADLAAVDRSLTPWVVLGTHRPFYIDSDYGPIAPLSDSDQDVAELLRQNVEPLLLKYEVDVVAVGHHHSLQRTCKVFDGKCLGPSTSAPGEPYAAPVHVVIGHAGQSLCHNLLADRPEYMEYVNDMEHGWSRIEANATTLQFKAYQNVDGKVLDAFNLYRY